MWMGLRREILYIIICFLVRSCGYNVHANVTYFYSIGLDSYGEFMIINTVYDMLALLGLRTNAVPCAPAIAILAYIRPTKARVQHA